MFRRRTLSLSILLLTAICTQLAAQDSATGAIRGTVLDATGARIPQASIVIVNTATAAR